MSNSKQPTSETRYLRAIIGERQAKADTLRNSAINPYPPRTGRSHAIGDALQIFKSHEASSTETDVPNVTVGGRIVALRNMGRIAFIDVQDDTGQIQVLASKRALGESWRLLDAFDLGDFLEASGALIRSRRGEISVQADAVAMLSKALRPPPEKYHGLQDVETRYRQRYLDLIANDEAKEILRTRSKIVSAMRRFMDDRGFLEVETPVLQSEAGGAAARPFLTHFNALDEPRQLRVALELHLKRLIVGGFDKVYEIGRLFRNEGIGNRWSPEFTMMESYEAYTDYHGVAEMVEAALSYISTEINGSTRVRWGDGEVDFTPPFARVTMVDAVKQHVGVDFRDYPTTDEMEGLLRANGVGIPPDAGWGKLFDELVSERVEPHLQQPTFLLDYPLAISPLAKRTEYDDSLVERFELFVGGWELANAYTELNDPVDQRQRFEDQLQLKAAGDDEAELLDEDFIVALEHGMPPTGGLGMGMDRLAMLLTNSQSIRDVILFPQMRKL
ncbi:MAG: lysine--tRNA ligase [Chloroflexi bacterium]|nr:lysine--tRNA ligase [Chloroflexota bacterium]MYJ02654.1 lysine--tRNA ligase [Chloroflexota bacterium]